MAFIDQALQGAAHILVPTIVAIALLLTLYVGMAVTVALFVKCPQRQETAFKVLKQLLNSLLKLFRR